MHLENGGVFYSKPKPFEFDIGLKAIHICDSGYRLEGNPIRYCSLAYTGHYEQQQWSGVRPRCVRGKNGR